MLLRLHFRTRLFLSFFSLILLLFFLYPYDNCVILFIRWQARNVRFYAKSTFIPSGHHHHATEPLHRVSASDIGLIIKTGYSTKDRLEARLKAMDERWKSHHVVVAGDYSSYAEMRLNGAMVEVHDVLTGLLKEDLDQKAKRMLLYQRFKKVTQDPAEPVPKYVLRSGEELDIMKVLIALLSNPNVLILLAFLLQSS